ncbi:MAG: NAD(+) synthetase, partial [Nitrososphaera sp.]
MKPSALEELLGQDYKKVSKKIEKFISAYISKSSAKGLVIGLSGGLDSSVALKLSVNALGRSNVL